MLLLLCAIKRSIALPGVLLRFRVESYVAVLSLEFRPVKYHWLDFVDLPIFSISGQMLLLLWSIKSSIALPGVPSLLRFLESRIVCCCVVSRISERDIIWVWESCSHNNYPGHQSHNFHPVCSNSEHKKSLPCLESLDKEYPATLYVQTLAHSLSLFFLTTEVILKICKITKQYKTVFLYMCIV